jgi:signal transduction histidine kinase
MDAILNTAPCGFLTFGDDGTVLAANQTLLNMLDRSEESVVGRHVEGLFTVASRIFYQTHFFPLLKMSGRADEIYLAVRTSQGTDLPVLVNAVRLEREGAVVYDCVLVPMRRRSQYEDEILRANRAKDQANAELEGMRQALEGKQGELQERNVELEALKESLEEQVQRRTGELRTAVADMEGFSSAIAHDLRAPLRAIVSASEILHREAAELLGPEHRDLLARQAFNGLKMSSLIDDLLRFAKLGRAGITREPLNFTKLATEVIADLVIPPRRKSPDFSVQSGMRIAGDPALARVVLENLIENAAKYSPQGGEIRVGLIEQNGRRVCFVRDQGIGFEMQHAAKIFIPFERLHGSEEFEGNGIGLATVNRIIDRHGGSIWFESAPGQGSTFYFTLEE